MEAYPIQGFRGQHRSWAFVGSMFIRPCDDCQQRSLAVELILRHLRINLSSHTTQINTAKEPPNSIKRMEAHTGLITCWNCA